MEVFGLSVQVLIKFLSKLGNLVIILSTRPLLKILFVYENKQLKYTFFCLS